MINAEKSETCNWLFCFNASDSTSAFRLFHSSSVNHRRMFKNKIYENSKHFLSAFTYNSCNPQQYWLLLRLPFRIFLTQNCDWLLHSIFIYFHLSPQRIAASSNRIGYRKLTFSSACLILWQWVYVLYYFVVNFSS